MNSSLFLFSPQRHEMILIPDTQFQLISGPIDFDFFFRLKFKSANKNSRCCFEGRPAIAENVENICKRKVISEVCEGSREWMGKRTRLPFVDFKSILR